MFTSITFSSKPFSKVFKLLLLATVMLLSACNLITDPKDEVKASAAGFWSALQAGDIALAQQFAVAGSLDKTPSQFRDGANNFSVEFGEILLGDTNATIVTTQSTDQHGMPLQFSFNTTLVKIDEHWQVDTEKTMQALVPAAMKSAFNGLGQAMNQGMQGLSKSFEQGAGELGAAFDVFINNGMVEMNQGLQQAAKELEKASQEMSRDLATELQKAGSIYAQKNNKTNSQTNTKNNSTAYLRGKIHSTPINFNQARYGQALELFSGDNWNNNPSLLIFLWLDSNNVADLAGKTFEITADNSNTDSNPHIHLRWQDPVSGELTTEITTENYNLNLEFSKASSAGVITGTLLFSQPEQNTRISGSFTLVQ